jgi:acetyl esterase/lipase
MERTDDVSEDRSVLTRPAPGPDAVRRYGDGPDQVIDLWTSADDGAAGRPCAVLVHGGFWRPQYDRAHLRPMANALRHDGWDVAAIEYRRQPGEPDAMVADVSAAVAAFDRPVVAVGHSAGGHLVLRAAATTASTVLATIALAPVADLLLAHELGLDGDAVAAFVGGEPGGRADLDPARLPTAVQPVVVVHGTEDEIVPLAVAESYVGRHPSTRLVPIQGAGHFALIDPLSTAWPIVVGELERAARA